MKRNLAKPHVFWSHQHGMWIAQAFIHGVWLFAVSFSMTRAINRAVRADWTETSVKEPRKSMGYKP